MPNPITIINDANENLKYDPNYKDYHIVYGHLTENSENAKTLRAAFINKVNPDYPHQIAFDMYPSRTNLGWHNGKKRFTMFAPTQVDGPEKKYDGLILFVDSAESLNRFILLVDQIMNERAFRHFSITIISNDINLTENQAFEQQLNIKPTYHIVELIDCEESIQVMDGLFIQKTIAEERVAYIVNQMSNFTLENNVPTLRDVVVNTMRGVLGAFY